MKYTPEQIERMTPWEREAAQIEVLREYLARAPERARQRHMRELGRLGGLAKAAKTRTDDECVDYAGIGAF